MPNYSAFHWAEKARKYAEKVGTIFNLKGRVDTVNDLPSTGNKVGDLYLVGLVTDTDRAEYAWLNTDNDPHWEKLGSTATSLSFSALTGQPTDNTNLATALGNKVTANTDITASTTAKLVTYDTKGLVTGSQTIAESLGYTPMNSSVKYGADLSYSNSSLQLKDQDGNALGTAVTIDNLPSQTGQGGKFLTTNGTSTSWGSVDALPSQSGQSGKFLTTDGSYASWAEVNVKPKTFNILDFKWEDHELNDQNWLKSDTFSWQDGSVYSEAYNHLTSDLSSATASTETVGSYTITVYTATDGHKIVLADMESTVANIYAESGVAWYYIVDTTNTRFKLPRSSENHGDLIRSYKNGTEWYRIYADGWVEQGNVQTLTNSIQTITLLVEMEDGNYSVLSELFASDSTSNLGVTARGTTTLSINPSGAGTYCWEVKGYSSLSSINQVKAQYKYLYFYVGEYSQSATEQTAGITTEQLNAKVDLDLSNMNAGTAEKETIVGWGMPDYTTAVSLSGTEYTATYKCWLVGYGLGSASNEGYLTINGVTVCYEYGDAYDVQIALDVGDYVVANGNSDLTHLRVLKMKGV